MEQLEFKESVCDRTEITTDETNVKSSPSAMNISSHMRKWLEDVMKIFSSAATGKQRRNTTTRRHCLI